jgi:hypothetical protein
MARPLKNKKAVEIPAVVYTDQFLRFLAHYAKDFKANNGYGKYWLKEWKRMEENGMFKPEKLRELYIDILKDESKLTYIYWDAVYCIGVQALDAAKTFVSTTAFDIRVITGEIAVNDDDEELMDLTMDEAISICDAMNEEAKELLFRVYNSKTNKLIK